MGGKLRLKSLAGGSVNLSVDNTLATDEEVIIPSDGNFGIESGSNSNGSWIKFPDGTLIQSGVGAAAIDTSTENKYGSTSGTTYYNAAVDITFPLVFIAAPNVVCNSCAAAISIRAALTTTTITKVIQRAAITVLIGDAEFSWQAIGRWK